MIVDKLAKKVATPKNTVIFFNKCYRKEWIMKKKSL